MKIAIIGGSGFIGTVLCKELVKNDHQILILDKNKSVAFPEYCTICDVRNLDDLIQHTRGHDVIYNLAAEHRDDVRPIQLYYDVNVEGARNTVKAAIANNIQNIIFTSTVAVYGLDKGESRESDTPDPFNDYGQSKLDAEDIYREWLDEKPADRTLTMMRLVATFGAGNRGNIYNLINQIASGRFMMIGSGQNKKSIAYVGNVAAFLNHCLNFKQGLYLYNYADKPDMDMNTMVGHIRKHLGQSKSGIRIPYFIGITAGFAFDILAKITGKTFPVSVVRIQKFCANTIVSAEKLAETGFERPYTLEDGFEEIIKAEFSS